MNQTVICITPEQIRQEIQAGKSIELIDVRTPAEYRAKHATIAKNLPLHELDAVKFKQMRNGSTQPVYIICHKGNRSKMACQKLIDAGVKGVISLEGGTEAWEAAGLDVVRGKNTFSVERQMRIGAGFLVLLGAALGFFVSPYFIGLSAFVGVGLIHAGITDTCGMSIVLTQMPWNRK